VSASASLDRALVSGIAATAVMRWSSQVISWIATFYVARILVPADYGIVAMATIAIGLARMVEDFGLDSILLQSRRIEGDEQARLAGFILGIGLVLCAGFVVASTFIAAFFNEPQVVWAVCGLSLLFVTDALQVVPRALLQRDLAFGKLAVAQFAQVVVTQGALIAAAKAGLGYKALVVNSIAGGLFVTALVIWWRPFAIRWPRDLRSLANPLLQGWRMLASRIGYYLYSTSDQTVIGRVLGKDALGVYSFATSLSTVAIQEVAAVVSKVVPGVFSASQDDRAGLRRYFLLLTETVSYLTFPMAVGLACTADLVVAAALGPQWQGVVVPLQLLCAYTIFTNAQMLVSHVLIWTGQFRAQMWCTMPTVAVMPLAFWIGAKWGVPGVAAMWVIAFPLTNVPGMVVAFRTISIGPGAWLRALVPALVSCAVMAGAVFAARELLPATMSLKLRCVAAILAGMAVYPAALFLLFRSRVMAQIAFVRQARAGGSAPPPPSDGTSPQAA
jgi:teichuronic acid exporter